MSIADLVLWAVIVAIVFALVRPGSPGPDIVAAVGDAVRKLVSVATGAAFQGGNQ